MLGLVMRMTPELEPFAPNYPTTPTEGRSSLDILNMHRLPLYGGSLTAFVRTRDTHVILDPQDLMLWSSTTTCVAGVH
ncbi:hypothetical protein TNCV_1446691 [Trichonephila clavipes]|nr:hypothetical protein TNCV_1446691 [Trichonephila clavipes]